MEVRGGAPTDSAALVSRIGLRPRLAVVIAASASGSGASPIGRRIETVRTGLTRDTASCSSVATTTDDADASEKPDADVTGPGVCWTDQSCRLGVGYGDENASGATKIKNAPANPHANHVMVLDTRSADVSARDARIQTVSRD
jgi:hypothetical protein